MSVTELFERKFLFGLGRHLWNIVGVSGFIALLTGIILFVNSNLYETAKSKENYIGRRKLITTEKIEEATKELLPYEDWVKAEEEKGTEKLLSLKEWSQKKGIDVPDTKTEQGKALKKNILIIKKLLLMVLLLAFTISIQHISNLLWRKKESYTP